MSQPPPMPGPSGGQGPPPMQGGAPRQNVNSTGISNDKSALYTAGISSDEGTSCVECCAIACSYFFTILFFPITCFSAYKVVRDYERAVIFRMGRVQDEAKGPGTFFILPCTDDIFILDIRTLTFDIPKQEILTADSVTVQVDAVVYYRVFNPIIAVSNVQNFNSSTNLLASSILRNVLGTKTLVEVLSEREKISASLGVILDVATDPWGVKVERIEIKDVRLPTQLQRALAAEAEAAREAKARIVAAKGEQEASVALKEASQIMSQSPGALSLRYFQTLTAMANERPSTILFPLPLEFLGAFQKR